MFASCLHTFAGWDAKLEAVYPLAVRRESCGDGDRHMDVFSAITRKYDVSLHKLERFPVLMIVAFALTLCRKPEVCRPQILYPARGEENFNNVRVLRPNVVLIMVSAVELLYKLVRPHRIHADMYLCVTPTATEAAKFTIYQIVELSAFEK